MPDVATIHGPKRGYQYPRYYFSNRSDDIRAIFCEHLDLIDVKWTVCSPFDIQIATRRDVAILDEFIGPKS